MFKNFTAKICGLIALVAVSTTALSDNQTKGAEPISAKTIANQVSELTLNLNAIRIALGKPKSIMGHIQFENVSTREVYFESFILYSKTNRLANEITLSHDKETLTPATHNFNLNDIYQSLSAASNRLLSSLNRLNATPSNNNLPETGTTKSDIFLAILKYNNQLNNLFYQRVSPSDVFEQVTLAVNYASEILQDNKLKPYVPIDPKFQPNKRPLDVYLKMIECIQMLHDIYTTSGQQMLDMSVNKQTLVSIHPGQVYDLSRILVEEIKNLYDLSGGQKEFTPYYPGYKTPSEVYQRLGILYLQLTHLKEYALKSPGWIKQER